MEAPSTAVTLRLVEIALPFHRPFSIAGSTVRSRRTVLVGLGDGTHCGWGEAAPFPGVTPDDPAEVWAALTDRAGALLDGAETGLPLTAAAAVDEARHDLAARAAGEPLATVIGGTSAPILASAAIGLTATVNELLGVVSDVIAAGFDQIKLKIKPGWDIEPLRAVREAFPALRIGVDANGSYDDPHDPVLGLLDALGPAYIEQPLAADDLGGHAFLRSRLDSPVCLDESVPSVRAARLVVEADAADILCVKPGRLGVAGCVEVHGIAAEAGLAVKATGLLESGIGRAHTIAVGCLPKVTHHDLATSEWYFAADVADRPFALEHGHVLPPTGPGIGVDVDEARLAEVAVREVELV
ncbi:MAG: enolase C-terminal domain-like protein [Acidimicrobiia bacterium]